MRPRKKFTKAKTNLTLPPALKEAAIQFAYDQGLSLSELVADLLRQAIAGQDDRATLLAILQQTYGQLAPALAWEGNQALRSRIRVALMRGADGKPIAVPPDRENFGSSR